MRKYIVLIISILLPAISVLAETEENIAANPHEIRIGLGESFLGYLFRALGGSEPYDPYMYNQPCHETGLPVEQLHDILSSPIADRYDYHTLVPHVFGEYMYRINRWLGIGVQTDFLGTSYRQRFVNGYGEYQGDNYHSELCWAIMPVARFTYLRREHVSLYSHIGIGYSGNFVMEDHRLVNSEHLPAFGATVLGISIGREHWFGTIELGTFNTAANFLFMERMLSLSAGYRF